MRNHRRVKLALQLCLSAIVCLALVLPAHAALIGLNPTFPDLFVNSTGHYEYVGETDEFTITATPNRLSYDANTFHYIYTAITEYSGELSYEVKFQVNSSGIFGGGVTGADLTVIGKVDNGSTYDGLLLTGEITGFGYFDPIGPIPPYATYYQIFDFTFEITGGQLADLFGGIGGPGGAIAFSEKSELLDWASGGFEGDFVKADNFPIPIPAAVWLFASGLIGLVVIRRKKRA